MRPRGSVAFGVFCIVANVFAVEQRIWVDATINQQPVRLIVDTGAFASLLYPQAARELGIKFFPPVFDRPVQGFDVQLGRTEPFHLATFNFTGETTFGIYDLAAAGVRTTGHGLYGWDHFKTNLFEIDAATLSVKLVQRVPEETDGWTKFAIAGSDTLEFEVPGEFWTIAVDTGSYSGISLRPQQWRSWKAGQTNAPITLDHNHMPSGGLTITEEGFAREITVANVRFTDVPISQPTPREIASGEVAFGLAALARLNLIVDGRGGWAYLRPKRTAPAPYEHNRLGAVFIRRHAFSDEAAAQVLDGSPAHTAGIRNGDALLKVDGVQMVKGRVAGVPLIEFWERPAGTRLELTIRRDDQSLKMPVVLRDILVP